MSFHDVDDPVDERHARHEEERTCCQRYLGSAVESQGCRSAERGDESLAGEDEEVIDSVGLHALFDGEAHECRREDDVHGRPVAAEELAE